MITLPELMTAKMATDDKSLATFRASIRAAVRGLWAGQTDLFDFIDMMYSAIRRGYEQAWQDGAKECGIGPRERTPEEDAALSEAIIYNQGFVVKYGDWIAGNTKADGAKLQRALDRAELWVNRYNEVKAKAQVMACQDKKLRWVLGRTERHCNTCRKLHGRVHRASVWRKMDIYPRDTRPGKLECRGFNCDCTLIPTDEPATPGRFPNLG